MTAVDVLKEIRDLIAARGSTDRAGMPTERRGVELPLVMMDAPIGTLDIVGFGPEFRGIGQGEIDLHHYTLGEVLISVSSIKPAALFSYGAEVRVTGINGNLADVLATSFVNTATGPLRVLLPLGSAFQQVRVEARQIVNGVPSGDGPQQNANLVGALLKSQGQIRIYR